MEYRLGLILEQIRALQTDLLMVPTLVNFGYYCLNTQWDILVVKWFSLIKASN